MCNRCQCLSAEPEVDGESIFGCLTAPRSCSGHNNAHLLSHIVAGIRQPRRHSHTVVQYSSERLDERSVPRTARALRARRAGRCLCRRRGSSECRPRLDDAQISRVRAGTWHDASVGAKPHAICQVAQLRDEKMLGRPQECGAQSHRSATIVAACAYMTHILCMQG